jgi:hypothetical protein
MVELSATPPPIEAVAETQADASEKKVVSRGELLARAAAAVTAGAVYEDATADSPASTEATLASTFFAFTRDHHAFLNVSIFVCSPDLR